MILSDRLQISSTRPATIVALKERSSRDFMQQRQPLNHYAISIIRWAPGCVAHLQQNAEFYYVIIGVSYHQRVQQDASSLFGSGRHSWSYARQSTV